MKSCFFLLKAAKIDFILDNVLLLDAPFLKSHFSYVEAGWNVVIINDS